MTYNGCHKTQPNQIESNQLSRLFALASFRTNCSLNIRPRIVSLLPKIGSRIVGLRNEPPEVEWLFKSSYRHIFLYFQRQIGCQFFQPQL